MATKGKLIKGLPPPPAPPIGEKSGFLGLVKHSKPVKIPKIKISNVKLPKLKPVKFPRVNAPKIKMPRFKAPHIEIPKLRMPKIEFPKLSLPKAKPKNMESKMKYTMPKLSLPKMPAVRFSAPSVTLPMRPDFFALKRHSLSLEKDLSKIKGLFSNSFENLRTSLAGLYIKHGEVLDKLSELEADVEEASKPIKLPKLPPVEKIIGKELGKQDNKLQKHLDDVDKHLARIDNQDRFLGQRIDRIESKANALANNSPAENRLSTIERRLNILRAVERSLQKQTAQNGQIAQVIESHAKQVRRDISTHLDKFRKMHSEIDNISIQIEQLHKRIDEAEREASSSLGGEQSLRQMIGEQNRQIAMLKSRLEEVEKTAVRTFVIE